MKYFFSLFRLQIQRIFKKLSTIICILLMPALIFAFGQFYAFSVENSDKTNVAFYIPPNLPGAVQVFNSLLENLPNGYTAFTVEDEQELMDGVENGAYDFAYIFSSEFDERAKRGSYSRLIVLVTRGTAEQAAVFNEAIASAIFSYVSPVIAQKQLEAAGFEIDNPEELWQLFEETVPTTQLETHYYKSGQSINADFNSLNLANALRGISAVFMFFFGIIFLVGHINDMSNGFFMQQQAYRGQMAVSLPTMLSHSTAILISGSLSILFAVLLFPAGGWLSAGKEIIALAVYTLYLAALLSFFANVFSKSRFLISLSPILLALCFIFCPIIIDVGIFLPQLGKIQAVFPPTLYLRAAGGSTGALIQMLILSAIFFALAQVFSLFKRKFFYVETKN